MPSLNITDFKGAFISGARPNLYKVYMSNLGQNIEFLAKGASLPASTIGNIDVPYLGRQIKVPGNRTFEPWTVTIFNDIDFAVRHMVTQWMDEINGHQSNLGKPAIADVYSDAVVEQLGRDGESMAQYHIVDMYPTEMSAIELAFDSNDTVEEFTVTFEMNYWEVTSEQGVTT